MPVYPRPLVAACLLLAAPCLLVPAAAQTLAYDFMNTRRELASRVWGAGNWMAFCVDEDSRDLNGDRDTEDTVLCITDLRAAATRDAGVAVNYQTADNEADWPIAFSGGDLAAIQVSEGDNGRRDLNGNGNATEDILCLFVPSTRQFTPLGVSGRAPRFVGGKLYFIQSERSGGKDLNGDMDLNDAVLCVCDPQTRQVETLGTEAARGFQAAGDWIAAETAEASQGNRDLNSDGDTADTVPQLYNVTEKKWTSTGLEASDGWVLTPKLLAAAVTEIKQGNRDLNGDRDMRDVVCHVWDLAKAASTNTGQDCTGGLAADDTLVALLSAEAGQGADLNGDRDSSDEVVQAYTLGTGVVNLRYDGSGGVAVGGGRIAFSVSEAANGNRDLNRDNDADDFVLATYDPKANRVAGTGWTVDGDLTAGEGTLAWRILEADQGDRDLNRDRDMDDSVLAVMDLTTGASAITPYAAGENLRPTARGIGFAVPELDQGEADLNMDRDADDDVLCVIRLKR